MAQEKNQYLENLKKVFENSSNFTPEKLQEFVNATMTQLFELKGQLESKDEKEREEGIHAAAEMKEVLEAYLEKMATLTSEEPSYFANLANQSTNGEEHEILKNATEQFQYIKKSFSYRNQDMGNKKINIIG